jgi:PAS domain S-box-containing protein
MTKLLHVLIVEDSEADAELVLRELQRGGYEVEYERVERRLAMEQALSRNKWDVILCDYSMPQFSAMDALETLKASGLDIPFLIVSGTIDEETAVTALKAGAHDFLLKGRLARLIPAIEREMRDAETRRLRRETESRYELLVEQLPIIVYVNAIENFGSTSYVSPQIQTILGYRAEEWLADPEFGQTALHPEDQPSVLKKMKYSHTTGEPFDMEYRMLARDGRVVWFRDQAVLIRDNRGQPLLWQGLKIDVTKQKEAEVERENLISNLEAANAELERFTYTAFHDLRAPLVTIKGFLGMLKKDLHAKRQDQIQKDIKRIEGAADKMDALLSDLLELSRIERVINPLEEVDLLQLTGEVLEMLDPLIRSKRVSVNVSTDLPIVYGDRLRLREVLENLIENAAKYTDEQANPDIEISTRIQDGQQIILVKDNGIGIDPRYHTRIFNLFEKLNPSMEGTGIGLALIKRIIELHGGKIWVESGGPGQGSTFCFTIADNRGPQKPLKGNEIH